VWSGLGAADAANGKGGVDRLCGDKGTDGTSDALGDFLGGGGSDKLDGGADRDVLKGEDGNDDVFGRNGADVLWGDAGNQDYVHGGDDLDHDGLHGGAGNDDTCAWDYNDTIYSQECENTPFIG
jgi:Ca2+-binding RTX toxin-like protein